MAGGIFSLGVNKVRPGTYVNVKSGKQPTAGDGRVGVAVIPLIGYDWGPRDEWIHLTNESPDLEKASLGRSIYSGESHMLMVEQLFQNATDVYVYICGTGEKASAALPLTASQSSNDGDGGDEGQQGGDNGSVMATAKYPGTLGNTIKLVSVANPTGGYDVSVYVNGSETELFEGITKASEITSAYVEIDGDADLDAFASVSLEGGSDDDSKMNSSVSTFLDRSEKIRFNCMAFPTEDESMIQACITKIKYIRENIGWKCQAVVVNTAADYEGIYNLTNAFVYGDVELTVPQATAWLAGAVAGADYVTSLTYAQVAGATGIVGEKTNEEAVQSDKTGETFFTVDESGNIILEYDINSKVTFGDEEPLDFNKGRACRVYDTLANELLTTFVPGMFGNTATDWAVMEGLGKSMLQQYEADGAITNVDLDNDFVVDQGASSGDSVYINVGIQAVDSAEKYYFTVLAN